MHDCQVVCPQCLAVCLYENDELIVRDDSDAPYRHTATVVEPPRSTARYCHSCGNQLPQGIRFCPYCGVDLDAPFEPSRPVKQEKPAPAPVEEKKSPVVKKEPSAPKDQGISSSQVEDKLRTIGHRYNANGMHLQQHGSIPSTTFKVVAYLIIALLLVLLVYIIIAGIRIDSGL